MGLFRLLFWVVVIFVVIWIWCRFISIFKSIRFFEDVVAFMVRCAYCGVHVLKVQVLN